MQDYQQKYLQEKRKYDNLLRMQNTILTDTEDYIAAFLQLKAALAQRHRLPPPDPTEEVAPPEAQQLVLQAAFIISQAPLSCQCDRWRTLYQEESRQSARLSQEKEELLNKLTSKEREEQLDRVEISKLLQDYLELYRKEMSREQQGRQRKKEKRSRSKGATQTDRKDSTKLNEHVFSTLSKFERSMRDMQLQLESLRSTQVEKEQLLRLYRSKERKHLLSGGQLLD